MKLSPLVSCTVAFMCVTPGAQARLRTSTKAEPSAQSNLIDLSQPLVHDPRFNHNSCSARLIELAEQEPEVRGMVVLEDGKIVTEYYKNGENQWTRSPIWSCTKSFTALILGVMVKDGLLSLDETLGEVFEYDPYNFVRNGVPDADQRMALTIESILTMTAGFSLPIDWLNDALFGTFEYGTLGGKNFIDSLTYFELDPHLSGNTFEYMLAGNILSYVIKERTRMTPEEFAKTQIFPLLGIYANDYAWHKNFEGVSYAWHGLFMTVRAMAKLGMLHLQQGKSSSTHAIIEQKFLWDSTRGTTANPSYGYGLWMGEDSYPERASKYLAAGFGSNVIYVDEDLGRVLALTSNNYVPQLAGGDIDDSTKALSSLVSDASCSFEA